MQTDYSFLTVVTDPSDGGLYAAGSFTTPSHKRNARTIWRFTAFSLAIAVILTSGLVLLVYPSAAAWVSQFNQSLVVYDQSLASTQRAESELAAQMALAREYNQQLESSAELHSGDHVARGTGRAAGALDYWEMLNASPTHTMARLRIPAIDLDLPVYHGTTEQTLLRGIGHLEGTSLPVGGKGTRSVLTGHRGLANATMFTNLDKVGEGDRFSVELLGEVLTYETKSVVVVEPDETEEIRPVPGEDLMTLVTCTPLGLNTHRILVTGERVTPTPQEDLDTIGKAPTIPHFPWWVVILLTGLAGIWLWYWRSGYVPNQRRMAPVPGSVSASAPASAQNRVSYGLTSL